jgi:hypothetical protein
MREGGVDMSHCGLRTAKRGGRSLVSLDLSQNRIGPAGAVRGACGEPHSRVAAVLAVLDLARNHVGDAVARVCAEALSLATYRVCDDGAIAIVGKRSLGRLDFLPKDTGFVMLEALMANEWIVAFNLSSNQIDTFAVAALRQLCGRNRKS